MRARLATKMEWTTIDENVEVVRLVEEIDGLAQVKIARKQFDNCVKANPVYSYEDRGVTPAGELVRAFDFNGTVVESFYKEGNTTFVMDAEQAKKFVVARPTYAGGADTSKFGKKAVATASRTAIRSRI